MEEQVDVVVVGAGLSGIGAACHLARTCPEETVAVLEARAATGGTWDLFRYPGVRSDSDMFTLAYGFRPWTGPTAIASGAEILDYLRATASAYGVDALVRLGHRVLRAEWSSEAARWRLRVAHGETESTLVCRFLWTCTGYYRYDAGHVPALAGLGEFGGTVVHPQAWPPDLDVAGARVVVVGSGATAISLVPALVAQGAEVTVLQRSPTYVAAVAGRYPLLGRPGRGPAGRALRGLARGRGVAVQTAAYSLARTAPRLARRFLVAGVRRRLPAGFDVATHFTPRYRPWEQRLGIVPDGDLFRVLGEGRAEIVTDRVDRVTATGVRTASGRELGADVLVTATGLELLGLGGIALVVDGRPVDVGATPALRGAMLAGVPNLAFTAGYVGAAWTLRADVVARFVTRLLRRMRRDHLAGVVPVLPDPPPEPRPLFPLRSGYVLRGGGRLPTQGARQPWVLDQNPVRERLTFRLRPLLSGLRTVPRRPDGAR